MQALRPLLRSCQRSSSGRVSAVIHHVNPPAIQFRAQHNDQGPHQEYFQTPGREPRPDLSPYSRDGLRQRSQYQPQSRSAVESQTASTRFQTPRIVGPNELPAHQARWPRTLIRLTGRALWLVGFLGMGIVIGMGLVTYEYLQPPFEPGSAEEQELVEEILDALDSHPAIHSMHEQGWYEVEAFTPDLKRGTKGKHFVHQALGRNNPQGVFMRIFHHPQQEATMIVAFMGFGVESLPDFVHTGVITSVLHEALDKHMDYYYPGYHVKPANRTSVECQLQCRPGEIYTMLLSTSSRQLTKTGNLHVTQLGLTGVFAQLVEAPVVQTSYDFNTNTEVRSVGIHAKDPNYPTSALCQAEIQISQKQPGLDAKAFQVGGKDDEGLNKILNAVAKSPSYQQHWVTDDSKGDKKEDGDE